LDLRRGIKFAILGRSGKLQKNNLNKTWLFEQLRNLGITDENEVFAAILDTQGRFYVSKKTR